MQSGLPSTSASPSNAGGDAASQPVCFVVMPFGQDAAEQRWFKGWFETVVKVGILAAGHRPVLAAAEEQPGAINDEIRAHLALDPMVVVDLGGMEPDDDPNPNVMYELGIRHALGLPLVIMAWAGQHLPFDVSNQRAIMERRDLLSLETNKARLTAFIRAAAEGKYYRPMEAVGRLATIEAASSTLGDESLLSALVQEVRQLKSVVASAAFPTHTKPFRSFRPTIKHALRSSIIRRQVYNRFLESGSSAAQWPRLLRLEVSQEFMDTVRTWGLEEWAAYVARRSSDLQSSIAPAHVQVVTIDTPPIAAEPAATLSEELIEAVRLELPVQPWPTGTHKIVRAKLGISGITYDRVVAELVRRGIFKKQIDGQLHAPVPGETGSPSGAA